MVVKAPSQTSSPVGPAGRRRLGKPQLGKPQLGKPPSPAARAEVGAPLTDRETEVLWLLAEGLSNKLIAGRLCISPHTAKFHVDRAIRKMGAATRTRAAVNFVLQHSDAARTRFSPAPVSSPGLDPMPVFVDRNGGVAADLLRSAASILAQEGYPFPMLEAARRLQVRRASSTYALASAALDHVGGERTEVKLLQAAHAVASGWRPVSSDDGRVVGPIAPV
jgi:DNA-binding CsgD family transcriptional regulator